MNETKLRERLLDLAGDAPKAYTIPPGLARRARRRIALTVISSVVVVASLVAGGIVGAWGLGGGANEPAVRPTESPTPSSTSTPIPLGALKPGTYVLETTTTLPSLRVTLSVPTGWRTLLGTEVVRGRERSGRWMGVFFTLVDSIYVDPCHGERGVIAVGPTVDDLATGLANQPRHPGAGPTDVTLDGYAGKYIVLTVPQQLNLTNCDLGEFRILRTPTGGVAGMGPGVVAELWILNVHNIRVVVAAAHGPGTSARDRAELRQIVASVHIEAVP